MYLYTSRKVYPNAITGDEVNDLGGGSSISAERAFSSVAFRTWNEKQDITNSQIVEYNDKAYIYLDAHATGEGSFTIPEKYVGRNIKTLKKSAGFILQSEVAQENVLFDVSALNNGYSYFVGELSAANDLSISDVDGLQAALDVLTSNKVTKGSFCRY